MHEPAHSVDGGGGLARSSGGEDTTTAAAVVVVAVVVDVDDGFKGTAPERQNSSGRVAGGWVVAAGSSRTNGELTLGHRLGLARVRVAEDGRLSRGSVSQHSSLKAVASWLRWCVVRCGDVLFVVVGE